MVPIGSELATNALNYAQPPTIATLKFSEENYVLNAADHAPEATPTLVSQGELVDGGFGLVLAERPATSIGWHAQGPIKRLWMVFAHHHTSRRALAPHLPSCS